jgi:hypothetical protein
MNESMIAVRTTGIQKIKVHGEAPPGFSEDTPALCTEKPEVLH